MIAASKTTSRDRMLSEQGYAKATRMLSTISFLNNAEEYPVSADRRQQTTS